MMRPLLTAAVIFAAAAPLSAQEVMPVFDPVTLSPVQAPGTWYTDRYAPAGFESVPLFEGRNNVIRIDVDPSTGSPSRPNGQQGTFYNTQGRKYDIGVMGSFVLSADLWLPQSWSSLANGGRSVGLWATAVDAGNAVSAYPIINFSNTSGSGLFRGWDGLAYQNFAGAPVYDAWNTMQIAFDGATFSYFLNGALQGSFAGGATAGIGNVILQSYNLSDPLLGALNDPASEYSTYFANIEGGPDSTVPEPATMTLLATGLAGMVAARRRRKAV